MTAPPGYRPAPTVRPPRRGAAGWLLFATRYPLIAGVIGAAAAWLLHRHTLAVVIAAASLAVLAALCLAALALAPRRITAAPWLAAILTLAVAAAAAWYVLPPILRPPAGLAAAGGLYGCGKATVRSRRRCDAAARWAQALAPAVGQVEQVAAAATGAVRWERGAVRWERGTPHLGAAPGAAWNLHVGKWAGHQIRQATLTLPNHPDISNPDFQMKVRRALTDRAGVKHLELSADPLHDKITLTVLDAPAASESPADLKTRAIERAATAAGMILPGVKVADAELNKGEAAGQAAATASGLAGAGLALRAFTLTYDPTIKVTRLENRDDITQHLSIQLYGEPGRLRALWRVELDQVRFELRRQFPDVIPHRVLDLSHLYGNRVILPFAEDEDGNIVVYPLDKTALPHGLVIGPTGGGKTTLLVTLAIEAARRGVEVVGCDPKRIELMGLRGWPGVTKIATRVVDMIRLINDFHTEMNERYEALETGQARESDFRRKLLILDEYYVFCMFVADWWRANRESSDPKEHPVIAKIGQIAAMARGAKMHMIIGTQRCDAVWFHEGARDNFGFRVSLGALSQQAAQMLWRDPRTGTDLPATVQGLCTATTPDGPSRAKVHFLPNPAQALTGELTGEDMELLRSLLPEGTTWDGPLPADAPDPGFEDSAAAADAVAADPVTGFLHLVRYVLRSRLAHLTAKPTGDAPATGALAAMYGWGTGTGGQAEPSGRWIGCTEETAAGRRVYLHPDRAFEAAQSFAGELEMPFPYTKAQLQDALRRSGLLIPERPKPGETRWTVRRGNLPGNDLPGDDRQRVWDLPEDAVIGGVPDVMPPPGPAGDVPAAAAEPCEIPAIELTGGARIRITPEGGGETIEATVDSVDTDPADPTQVIINYRGDDGEPDAVTVGARELIPLAQ